MVVIEWTVRGSMVAEVEIGVDVEAAFVGWYPDQITELVNRRGGLTSSVALSSSANADSAITLLLAKS